METNLERRFRESGINEFTTTDDRLACLLLIDRSGSMASGGKMLEVIKGLNILKNETLKDVVASRRVEIGVVTYGDDVALVREFCSIASFSPPEQAESIAQITESDFIPNGCTEMGKAIRVGIQEVEKRKLTYKNTGIGYYRPWIVNLTDGEPTDHNTPNWHDAVQMVQKGTQGKRFVFFNLGTEDANFAILKELIGSRNAKIREQRFQEFFMWLSQSVRVRSNSALNEEIPLPTPLGNFLDPA